MGTPLPETSPKPYVVRLVNQHELVRMTRPGDDEERCWAPNAKDGRWERQLRYDGELHATSVATFTSHQVAAAVNAYRAAGWRLVNPAAVTL